MALSRCVPLETVRLCYAEDVRIRASLPESALMRAFATVPREHYLGPGPWKIGGLAGIGFQTSEDDEPRHLYHDILIAIDPERHLNNGQPSALAAWLSPLDLQPGDTVYHAGCGLGYYTAIIAETVGPEGHVIATEIDEGLAARARNNLAHFPNVKVVAADGITFDPGERDAIFINMGVTHPQPLWIKRLRQSGRLVAPITAVPVNAQSGSGHMLLVRRNGESYSASFESPVMIYSSETGRDANFNSVLGSLFREAIPGRRADIRAVRLDEHQPGETCWLHGEGFCLSSTE